MSRIKESIEKLLKEHRILLWYDGEQSFAEEYEKMKLSDANKVMVENNEFAVKVKVLVEEPQDKFLLYIPKEKPKDDDNWFLDLELANHIYYTDQASLYLQEIGLPYHYKHWIQNHIAFFKSKERIAAFERIAKEEDGDFQLSLKLLQVVFGTDTLSLMDMLREYTSAYINDTHQKINRELERFRIKDIFWNEVAQKFGYRTEDPSIFDFLLEAFPKGFTPLASKSNVNREALVMLSNWKDTLSFQKDFQAISLKIQDELKVKDVLEDCNLEEILEDDVFALIDKKVISALVRGILNKNIDSRRIESIIKVRESKYWYEKYRPFYRATEVGYNLIQFIQNTTEIKIESFEEGIAKYQNEWYKIDQYYRIFIQYYRETNQNNVLNPLCEAVNKSYSNDWLLSLNHAWQKVLDKKEGWSLKNRSQAQFFKNEVQPFIDNDTRLFVVISDALRYECGVSFHELMSQEKRFESDLDYQVSSLPSYTSLCMAAMLPHEELSINNKGEALIDGQSTKGKERREKILKQSGVRSKVMLAEELLSMSKQEAKEFTKKYDLIYVYHNKIDNEGDNTVSEKKVVDAAKEEITYLVNLVKAIRNMNGNNILVTSDHGFIYQYEKLEESDFADAEISGDLFKTDRRYVIGTNLKHKNNVVKYKGEELGLKGDIEVLIPKGINRLRKQGSGSRFVHGGASLHEIVVPIIRVRKKRVDTIQKVDVDVLNKTNNKISTNIQRVRFFQLESVSDKYLPRTLKMQFKGAEGEKLSDVASYTFNADSDNPQDREYDYQFQLSSRASTEYKNKTVHLVLEEQVKDSNKWVEYKRYPYTINISFASDFDDF